MYYPQTRIFHPAFLTSRIFSSLVVGEIESLDYDLLSHVLMKLTLTRRVN